MAAGKNLQEKKRNNCVAVIGDGAITGGMAYEAMNNAAYINSRVIVILNDNGQVSIYKLFDFLLFVLLFSYILVFLTRNAVTGISSHWSALSGRGDSRWCFVGIYISSLNRKNFQGYKRRR